MNPRTNGFPLESCFVAIISDIYFICQLVLMLWLINVFKYFNIQVTENFEVQEGALILKLELLTF